MKKSEELELWRLPRCEQHLAYCTSNKGGRCLILTDTHFSWKTCPFFRDKREERRFDGK